MVNKDIAESCNDRVSREKLHLVYVEKCIYTCKLAHYLVIKLEFMYSLPRMVVAFGV